MTIREAQRTDLTALARSMENLIRYSKEKLDDPYVHDIDTDHETSIVPWFEEALEKPDAVIYIAEHNGALAGFVVGKLTKPFVKSNTIDVIGHIEMCWVEPEHRSLGLGRSLIESVESWFKHKGVEYVDIHYLEINEEAKRVWAHLGFKPFRTASRKKI